MASSVKEIWKAIPYLKGMTKKNYAVSNLGRISTYIDQIKDVTVLKPILYDGMYRYTIHQDGKTMGLFPCVAVANVFLKKPTPKQTKIIHLDYDITNTLPSNLKWVTKEAYFEHRSKDPKVIQRIKTRVYSGHTAKKLDEKKVVQLKKEIWNPKRKLSMKQIAEKYGIAEMNLYRIKAGILWFHVHVDGEPIHDRYKQQLKNIELQNKNLLKENQEKAKRLAAQKISKQKADARKKLIETEKKNRAITLLKKRKERDKERAAIEKRKAIKAKLAQKRDSKKGKTATKLSKKSVKPVGSITLPKKKSISAKKNNLVKVATKSKRKK